MSATGMPSSQHAAALRIIGATTSRPRSRAWTGPTVTASSPVPNHALEITPERLAEGAHQPGVRLPRDVLGRIEGREPPYFSFSLIFDRKPPSWNVDRASANSSAVP